MPLLSSVSWQTKVVASRLEISYDRGGGDCILKKFSEFSEKRPKRYHLLGIEMFLFQKG